MRQYAIAVIVVTTACSYRLRDTCVTADCTADNPPTAIIDRVDANGNVAVGAAGDALLDGSKSSDPDGDALTFAWAVDAACGATIVGSASSAQVRLSGLAVGSACTVTLTVADPSGLTGDAGASLIVADVGAYVTNDQQNCLAGFDPNVSTPQGTPDHPFCAIADGLAAAKAYSLADVSLDTGVHLVGVSLTIDFPVTVRGGYASGAAAWTHNDGAFSDVQLHQGSAATDTTVVVDGATAAGLRDVAIYRMGACQSDCALVTVTNTAFSVDHVNLGETSAGSVMTGMGDSGGHNISGINVSANADAGVVYTFDATNLTIVPNVTTAPSATGVFAAGAVALTINGLSVSTQNAATAIGVRTSATTSVSLSALNLGIVGTTFAAGIVDGNRDRISGLASGCGTDQVCGGSGSLSIDGGSVNVDATSVSGGFMVLGTLQAALANVTMTVSGAQAWGVLLSGSGAGGPVDIGTIKAAVTTLTDGSTAHPFGIAVGDNYIGQADAPSLGSSNINLHDSQLQASVGGLGSETAIVVCLQHSKNPQVANNSLSLQTLVNASGSPVTYAAGVYTLATDGAAFTDNHIASDIEVTAIYAGFADGQFASGPIDGSSNMKVMRTDMHGRVKADSAFAFAAQMIFSASSEVMVSNQYRADLTLDTTVDGPAAVYGVVLLGTHDLTLQGMRIDVASSDGVSAYGQSALFVGVHDGGLDTGTLDQGSDGLQISGNVIFVQQNGASLRGIELRGTAAAGLTNGAAPTVVDDNVINALNSVTAIGIFTQSTNAVLAYNTVRVDYCATACAVDGPYGVGYYDMHPEGFTLSILANSFNAANPGDANDVGGRPAIVWHSSAATLDPSTFSESADNLWGTEAPGDAAPYVTAFSDSSNDVRAPTIFDVSYSSGAIRNATNNQNVAAAICADLIHGAAAGPQENAAKTVTTIYGADVDGLSRNGTTNIGADAHLQVCVVATH